MTLTDAQKSSADGNKLPGVGDTLGQYQLLAQVGSGGMGRVWAARQVGALQRLVAIKTALTEGAQTAEFERVFLDEARIASLIHHPHVCGVYELGEENAVLFLVMEWSDGGTLLEVLKRQPSGVLQPSMAAAIVAKVCAGLHAAHELEDECGEPLNVVHRDVTPQNILLSSQGHVRLADFGVAKAQGQIHRPTETGEVKGKLNYMAPEQLTSKLVDRRVDIFALGCVLYECTAGRRPFQGDGALSTLYQILEQEVESPAALVANYPPELARIALKALSKQPSERYQTAEEMQKDLEAWLITQDAQITENQISRLVMDALGDSIRARNELIDLAIERFDNGELADVRVASSGDAPAESSAPGVSTAPRPSEGRGAVWPVAVGVLVAALTASLFLMRSTDKAVAVAVPALAAASQAVQPGVEHVRVKVTTFPEHASVSIDGEPARDTPFALEVEKDMRVRELTVSAPGYQTKHHEIRYDQTQEVTIRLMPVPSAPATAASAAADAKTVADKVDTKKNSKSKKSDSVSAARKKEPEETARPVDTNTASKPKGARALDPENPF